MAKTKIDKDDIKRLVENTSNPSSTTSVYSAKYVDDNYATSTDVQTAVASVYKLKGNIADKDALLLLTNVKQGDVYNAQTAFTLTNGQNVQNVKDGDNIVCLSDADTSEETNWDNLCGNIDYDDLGDMPVATDTEVGGIKIGFVPELDADLLDGKHADEFADVDHVHTNLEVTTSLGYTPYNATNPDGYTSNLGTVTAVTGTSPILSTGGTTPKISLKVGHADDVNPFSSKPAKHVYAAPNGVAGTPSFRALVASDIPTLNQNTTGNAATASSATRLTNAREINGVPFDGTADITIPGSPETIQLLSAGGTSLNNLADGIYQLHAPTDTYPDSVCGNIVGTVIPEGTEILRQYTVFPRGEVHKTQIMLIGNKTYRRSGVGTSWNEWVRLITCRDMADYVTTDMLETSDGGDLEPYNSVDVYRDTTYTIYGDAKEGKYIINLMPLFTSPPLEIIEIDIVIAPKSSGEYTLEIQLSEYAIDTRESSSSTTAHFGDYASITIPQGTSFVLLKIYMFENVQRCLIIYTFS